MKAKFKIVGVDLMCTKIDKTAVDFKLAEVFGTAWDFEDVEFLNEIHKTTLITAKLLAQAEAWAAGRKVPKEREWPVY